MARDYESEYKNYHAKPEQRKKNASRKRARRLLEKEGKVKPFDGKDVIHKSGNPNNNSRSNLGVQSKSENRSFARTKSARKKNKTD
jgi:hypothetical protein